MGNTPSGTCLGSGSYGTVERCSFSTAAGQRINDAAVKTAVGGDPADLRAAEDSLTSEARAICRVHARCRCPDNCCHVPRLLAVIPSPDGDAAAASRARALVFPAYPTCLYEHLKDAKGAHTAGGGLSPVLPLPTRLRILLHVTRALSCAARARIVHCDVKPSNIMIDGQNSAVLIDWGLATPHGEYCQGAFGTSAYVPPEMLDPAGFVARPSLDVWSIGVVCLEMVLPRRLTADLQRDDVYALLQAEQLYAAELAQLAAAPEVLHCERTWASVILRCLHYNPKRRASLKELEAFAVEHLAAVEAPPARMHARPSTEASSGSIGAFARDADAEDRRRSTDADSSLASSFGGGGVRIPAPHGAPTLQTAAQIAASTAAVLRLASVNSSAAFDLLRKDADSAFLSGASIATSTQSPTPHNPTDTAPHGQVLTCQPPAHEVFLRSPRDGLQPWMGMRAASTPMPLAGTNPLSSCELESFDRFTDRARPAAAAVPLNPHRHSALNASPGAATPPPPPTVSTPPLCTRKRTRRRQSQSRPGTALGLPPAQPATDMSPDAAGRPCPPAAAAAALDHRHPFGLSPPHACHLPFAADPVITAAASPTQCRLGPPPRSADSSAALTAHDSLLHLHLPRVRTVCHDSGGSDRLPEIDSLLPASPAGGRGSPPSGTACVDRDRSGCQMSFGKFGAYTPTTSTAAAAATALAQPTLHPLARVQELLPPSGQTADGTDDQAAPSPQHVAHARTDPCTSALAAMADILLFRMDDEVRSSPCGQHAESRVPHGAAAGIPSWLQALHVSEDRRADAEEQAGFCDGASPGGGSAVEGGGSRRRWTGGEVSLHAAHCSVLSDLPDACMLHSPAAQHAQRDARVHE